MVGALRLQDVEDVQGHGNAADPGQWVTGRRQRDRAQMMWAARARDKPTGLLPGRRRLGRAASARIAQARLGAWIPSPEGACIHNKQATRLR